jgi:hypothetical protein
MVEGDEDSWESSKKDLAGADLVLNAGGTSRNGKDTKDIVEVK